jgi:hypothetical protein
MSESLSLIKKYLTIYPDRNRSYINIGGSSVPDDSWIYKNIFIYNPLCPDQGLEQHKGIFTNVHIHQHPISNRVYNGLMKTEEGSHHFVEDPAGDLISHVLDFENIHIVDFLKVDTDGNELLVLKGGVELLKRCKPLVQVALTGYKWTVDGGSISDFMFGLGYKELGQIFGSVFFYVPEIVENIEKNNIFCFWTGTNAMTQNRLGCMYNLRTQTESNIVLITVDNLPDYILESDPLHEAYNYLSETHKCDYLRIYFMHHYGGGYTDIKSPRRSWAEAFQQMRDDPTKIINGYHEKGEYAIAYRPSASKWEMLCGNGSYILRPRTALTYAWYKAMLALMDEKVDALREHPATRVEDAKEWGGGYPLEWNEMLGRIFHRVLADFDGFILYTTPKVYGGWYR